MKQVFTLIAFAGFSYAAIAQSNINPRNDYRQKKFLDSLQKLLPEPAITIIPQPRLVYDIPVVPLINEGKKTGMSGEDTVYTMKTDKMPLLKPNMKTTYIPNAAEGKMFMIPPAKKKSY